MANQQAQSKVSPQAIINQLLSRIASLEYENAVLKAQLTNEGGNTHGNQPVQKHGK